MAWSLCNIRLVFWKCTWLRMQYSLPWQRCKTLNSSAQLPDFSKISQNNQCPSFGAGWMLTAAPEALQGAQGQQGEWKCLKQDIRNIQGSAGGCPSPQSTLQSGVRRGSLKIHNLPFHWAFSPCSTGQSQACSAHNSVFNSCLPPDKQLL